MDLRKYLREHADGLLLSYGQILFSRDRVLSVLVMLATFSAPRSALFGVASVVVAQLLARLLSFDAWRLRDGTLTFNSLLTGLLIGGLYVPDPASLLLLIVASSLSLLLTVWISAILARHNLPNLSAAFLLTSWVVVMGAQGFSAFNGKMITDGHGVVFVAQQLTDWYHAQGLPDFIEIYLRSLGAIFFQYDLLSGSLIAIGLLYHSRIAFLLTVVGFGSGYLFYSFLEGDISQLIYSYIGYNFILTAIALGGYYFVPGRNSFLLVVLVTPVMALLISALDALFRIPALPLYALPLNVVVLMVLAAMGQRMRYAGLPFVAVQHNSPELNLYAFLAHRERYGRESAIQVRLPIMGEWTISQGYNGGITHKGEWASALDFDVRNAEGKTYNEPGGEVADYFCFDRPVVAPAEGRVVKVLDGIKDNPIKGVDLRNNWGNTVVIQHAEGLYSKLSHLRMGSIRVEEGDRVEFGEVLASCGSSGRSPEPHVHFQVQSTPFIGSRTLAWPIGCYLEHTKTGRVLHRFEVPKEGARVSNVVPHAVLSRAFDLVPGRVLAFRDPQRNTTERWEVMTDAYNSTCIHCAATESSAWFTNDGALFSMTGFVGDRTSLLYRFHIATQRVLLGWVPEASVEEGASLSTFFPRPLRAVHDLTAPFFQYCQARFSMAFESSTDPDPHKIVLRTTAEGRFANRVVKRIDNEIELEEGRIVRMRFNDGNQRVMAECVD